MIPLLRGTVGPYLGEDGFVNVSRQKAPLKALVT